MTNTEKLENAISESGITKRALASKLGITEMAFYNKVNDKSPFKASEMLKLCELLSIKNPVEIFLDQ